MNNLFTWAGWSLSVVLLALIIQVASHRAAPEADVAAAAVPDEASAQADKTCDRAWADAQARAAPATRVFDRERFVSLCTTLPELVQQCLDSSYTNRHQADCAAAQKNLSPQQTARLKALLGT